MSLLEIRNLTTRFYTHDGVVKAVNDVSFSVAPGETFGLVGESGSGKTFLGWVMVMRTSPSVHHVSPDAFIQSDWVDNEALHVIDNAPSDPNSLRRLIAEMQLRNIRTSLIISPTANAIGLPSIHLPAPTSRDITAVYNTLNKLEQYALTPRQEGNLWQIIHSVL